MHVVVLGVSGSLMSAIAVLAKQLGHRVTGYDRVFRPPASDVLKKHDIVCKQGYDQPITIDADTCVVVGNQMTRNMPIIADLISRRVPMLSAPQWLAENVLQSREVIAVAGCHGKTTTTAMVAHMLKQLGEDCGYIIAGNPASGEASANLGSSRYFVIEADEYDSAFFDKRPKFMHYWPVHLVLGKVEFDHADIYADFKQMLIQYKYLLRLIPDRGSVISQQLPDALLDQIKAFDLQHTQITSPQISELSVPGVFNQLNASMALRVGEVLGFPSQACKSALRKFQGVKRRCEVVLSSPFTVIDDHAHHPTAVEATLGIFAENSTYVLYYPATHTQKLDVHQAEIIAALDKAKQAYILLPDKHYLDQTAYVKAGYVLGDQKTLITRLKNTLKPGDRLLVLSPYYLTEVFESLSSHAAENHCVRL